MSELRGTVEIQSLRKDYSSHAREHTALAGISLSIRDGQFVVVRGRSGSGKSTLLHCIAGLQQPTSGRVLVAGQSIHEMSETESAEFRRRHVGIVYQFFNLVTTLDVEYNVGLPLLLDGHRSGKIRPRTMEILEELEISHLMGQHVNALSGGEMQRVAIARAMIVDPALILADEPTGNLDSKTAGNVLGILRRLNRDHGVTVIMMTHDPEAVVQADRVLVLSDGQIEEGP